MTASMTAEEGALVGARSATDRSRLFGMFESYTFVALTSPDLDRARRFWCDQLGFTIVEHDPEQYLLLDVAGLRLYVDRGDGDAHIPGGTDPVIGLKVANVREVVATLKQRGLRPSSGPMTGERGSMVRFKDPDGRTIIITDF